MQIAPLAAASGLTLAQPAAPLARPAPGDPAEGFRPSEWSLLAASYGLTALSYHETGVQYAYRKNGSLAVRAQSSVNVNLRSESVSLDLVLPAESLGIELPAEWFANGPLKLSFEYHRENVQFEHKLEARWVKTLRTPDEILRDLGKAVGEVLSQKGDKSLHLSFDEEALQALMSDPKIVTLLEELIALIRLFNSLRLEGGPRQKVLIEVSGKGQPYLEVQEQTGAAVDALRVQVNLAIMPPEGADREE